MRHLKTAGIVTAVVLAGWLALTAVIVGAMARAGRDLEEAQQWED